MHFNPKSQQYLVSHLLTNDASIATHKTTRDKIYIPHPLPPSMIGPTIKLPKAPSSDSIPSGQG